MYNIVILNDSTQINCTVTVTSYTVQTSYGPLSFDADAVSYIEYRSPANNGRDELFASDGSSYYGKVLPAVISIEVANQFIEIPTTDIRFIVLLSGTIDKVSDETKAKLRALNLG